MAELEAEIYGNCNGNGGGGYLEATNFTEFFYLAHELKHFNVCLLSSVL